MAVLHDSYAVDGVFPTDFDNGAQINAGLDQFAQNFIAAGSYTLVSIKLPLTRSNNPGNFYVHLYSIDGSGKPSVDLGSGISSGNTLNSGTSVGWREVTLDTPVAVVSGTEYSITIDCDGANAANAINWWFAYVASPAQEEQWASTDGATSWTQRSANYGFGFATYDNFAPPSARDTKKRLISVAEDALWYEDI